MKYKVKAILFDYDLTLVDSLNNMKAVRNDLETNHGVSYEHMIDSELWGRSIEHNSRLLAEKNTHLSWEEIETLTMEYTLDHCLDAKIRHQPFLHNLKKRGIKIGIVTGNLKEAIDKVVQNDLNKSVNFDIIYGDDRTSKKTKSELIGYAIGKLGVDPLETIYAGDHLNDVLAAKDAGVISCAVCTGFHTKDDFLSLRPDLIIKELSEIENHLG